VSPSNLPLAYPRRFPWNLLGTSHIISPVDSHRVVTAFMAVLLVVWAPLSLFSAILMSFSKPTPSCLAAEVFAAFVSRLFAFGE